MDQLQSIRKKYKIENGLFQRITLAIKYGVKKNDKEYIEFLNSLP